MRFAQFIFPVLFVASSLPAVADLSSNQAYKNGIAALESGLPEQAATRLKSALEDENLTDEQRLTVLLKLCEALVRARKGAEAETILLSKELKGHGARPFWLGQALVAQGEYRASIEPFTIASQDKSAKKELEGLALMSLAGVYQSLNEAEKSMLALKQASKIKGSELSANLLLGQLYLESSHIDKAQKVLLSLKPVTEIEKRTTIFLQAQLALQQKNGTEAEQLFSSLLKLEDLSVRLKEGVELGVADAKALAGEHDKAVGLVLELIKVDLDSPSLQPMFNRLIVWSTEIESQESLNEQLEEWVKAPETIIGGQVSSVGAGGELESKEKASTVAVSIEHLDLDAYSRYLLAKNYGYSGKQDLEKRALKLLATLRDNHPMHSLHNKSLFLTASIQLEMGETKEVVKTLKNLSQAARTNSSKAQALFLIGEISAEQKNDEEATAAFSKVIETDTELSEDAKVNLALIHLRNGSLASFTSSSDLVKDQQVKVDLLYERAVRAIANGQPNGRELLSNFIAKHGKFSKIIEAKLMLATDQLAFRPLKPAEVKRLITEVRAAKVLKEADKSRVDLLELSLLVLEKKWEQAVSLGENLSGEITETERFKLTFGEAYYRNGEFNKARKVFNKIANSSEYAEFALFFSALSAVKEGTPQSKQDALNQFDTVIERKGSLQYEAMLQKARLLIDNESLMLAEKLISKALKEPGLSKGSRQDLKVLLADTLHRMGGKEKDPKRFAEALKVYNELIDLPGLGASWNNRLLYLKGQTQEKIDPTFAAPLDTYFKVVNLENQQDKNQPQEWLWYYKAGLRAVDLLEKLERWKAAAVLLRKMEGFNGPKTDVLRARAEKIELTHHIWE